MSSWAEGMRGPTSLSHMSCTRSMQNSRSAIKTWSKLTPFGSILLVQAGIRDDPAGRGDGHGDARGSSDQFSTFGREAASKACWCGPVGPIVYHEDVITIKSWWVPELVPVAQLFQLPSDGCPEPFLFIPLLRLLIIEHLTAPKACRRLSGATPLPPP